MRVSVLAALLGAVLVGSVGCGAAAPGSSSTAGQLGLTFNVNVSRPIGGTITSLNSSGQPDGKLNCGPGESANDCGPVSYAWNEKVTLAATPDRTFRFFSWAADCSGTSPCTLDTNTYAADKWIAAAFVPTAAYRGTYFLVTVNRPAGGTIATPDHQIDCGTAGGTHNQCGPAFYRWDGSATVTATPDAGFAFASWTDDCAGRATCTLDIRGADADKVVSAAFSAERATGCNRVARLLTPRIAAPSDEQRWNLTAYWSVLRPLLDARIMAADAKIANDLLAEELAIQGGIFEYVLVTKDIWDYLDGDPTGVLIDASFAVLQPYIDMVLPAYASQPISNFASCALGQFISPDEPFPFDLCWAPIYLEGFSAALTFPQTCSTLEDRNNYAIARQVLGDLYFSGGDVNRVAAAYGLRGGAGLADIVHAVATRIVPARDAWDSFGFGCWPYYDVDEIVSLVTFARAKTSEYAALALTCAGTPSSPLVTVSPPTGERGTVFSQSGAGFTGSGEILLVFDKPDGTRQTMTTTADANGAYPWLYDSSTADQYGIYKYSAIDVRTQRVSNTATFEILPNGSWSVVPSRTSAALYGVRGDLPDRVWAVGNGVVLAWNGTEWRVQATSSGPYYSIWGQPQSDFWIFGGNRQGWTCDLATGSCSSASSPGYWPNYYLHNLVASWGSAPDDVWAIDILGYALHWNGAGWVEIGGELNGRWWQNAYGTPVHDQWSLFGIWGGSSADVWAVGQNGAVVHWDGITWSEAARPTPSDLHGVWGASSRDVWAVGTGGAIMHWDGSSWSSVESGTASDLFAVWGTTSANAWAVGANGTVLHWNGALWSPVASGTANTLRAVWGLDDHDVWAVGDAGTVLRYR